MIQSGGRIWIANKNKGQKKVGKQTPMLAKKKVAKVSKPKPGQAKSQPASSRWVPQISKIPRGLSACAMKYVAALYNPSAEAAQGACIPDQYALPSQKFSTSVKGWAYVGTNGVAQVLVYPWAMVSSSQQIDIHDYKPAESGTVYPVTFTTPSFTADNPTLTELVAPGNAEQGLPVGVSQAASNSPYSETAVYGTDRKFRVVGSGVRVQYEGAVLGMQGTWLMYRSSTNTNQFPSTRAADLLRLNTTTRVSVTKAAVSQNYVPITPQDLEYVSGVDSLTAGGNTNAYTVVQGWKGPKVAYTIALVGGTPGAAISFEVFTHFEMIGTGIPLTRNAPDPVAVAHIVTAAPSVPHHPDPVTQLYAAFQGVMKSVEESHELHKFVVGGVMSALGMPELAVPAAMGAEYLEQAFK